MRALPLLLGCASCVIGCRGDPAPPATPPVAPPSATQAAFTASSSDVPLPTASSAPLTSHPRIWITAGDLPRLRSWATTTNPVWQDGIVPAMRQAISVYEKEFFPGGRPNPTWPDTGITNWVGRATEAYAEFFAFLSLVDPDASARAADVTRARNLLMHVIHEAAKGEELEGQNPSPFRNVGFATYNRASEWGEAFGLTVDWIYSALNADDKAQIRKVFLRWADDNVRAATSGDEHPEPIGLLDDRRLVADKKRLRWSVNNYFTAHMRQLTLYGLSLDAADDPPIDPHKPAAQLGNTLRSYLDDALGAWLYQQYAVYEDPAVSAPALGVPPEGLGVASGGLSPEGFLYGISVGMLHEALLALYTAGYRDPRAFGPQIRLIDSGFWDRMTEGMLQSLVAEPALVPEEKYLGPVYQMAAYGDVQRFYLMPGAATPFLSLAIHAAATGNAAQLDRARWVAVNAVQGTAPGLAQRIAGIWGNSEASLAILNFLALDPKTRAVPDPRPTLPLAFYDRAIGRIISRSAWGPNGTMFDYKCTWETIGHQFGDCNQFEMWRKGEWLVKERTGYANDNWVITSEYHNTLAIQNRVASGAAKPKSIQWFEEGTWERGGQFTLGMNAGDPKVLVSLGPGWAAAQGDATTLYNRPSNLPGEAAMDVTHASRSIAWLKPDYIVVYDRATTRSDNLFKRFYLVSGGDPEVSGKLATFTTPRGQKLYVHTLLPVGAVLTASKAEAFNQLAAGEPSRSKLKVEDPASPRDVRFLHVLQGADAGTPPAPVTLIQSSAGTPFAGAAIGRFAAVFPVDLGVPFARVTYTVPDGVDAQLVGGLQPGARYDVSVKTAAGSVESTVTPGATYQADEGGVITLGLSGRKP
ncbi:MAG TPA: hypothetical protein VGL81_31355 [Polyangiaceae bacterium]